MGITVESYYPRAQTFYWQKMKYIQISCIINLKMHPLYVHMELKYLSIGKIALFRMLAQHQTLDSRDAEYS